jgi:hypothetical protein
MRSETEHHENTFGVGQQRPSSGDILDLQRHRCPLASAARKMRPTSYRSMHSMMPAVLLPDAFLLIYSCHVSKSSSVTPSPMPPEQLDQFPETIGEISRHLGHTTQDAIEMQCIWYLQLKHAHDFINPSRTALRVSSLPCSGR